MTCFVFHVFFVNNVSLSRRHIVSPEGTMSLPKTHCLSRKHIVSPDHTVSLPKTHSVSRRHIVFLEDTLCLRKSHYVYGSPITEATTTVDLQKLNVSDFQCIKKTLFCSFEIFSNNIVCFFTQVSVEDRRRTEKK